MAEHKEPQIHDGTSEPGETDQNWREHMLRALQEGILTTMITFANTRYLVTLQPYEPGLPLGAHKRDICSLCGQIVVLPLGGQGIRRWYHREAEHGTHAAVPLYHVQVGDIWQVKGETTASAATPVKAEWAGPKCTICGRSIAFNGKSWVHTELTYLDHDAAAAPGAGPKIANLPDPTHTEADLRVGARATCKMCGKPIVYVNPYWQHEGLLSPRHPALPSDE